MAQIDIKQIPATESSFDGYKLELVRIGTDVPFELSIQETVIQLPARQLSDADARFEEAMDWLDSRFGKAMARLAK